MNNFFWGTDAPSGGHSYLLDTLSSFGIIGLIALIISFRYLYKRFVKPFKPYDIYTYAVIAFSINIVQCFINTYNGLIAFTLILPVFAIANYTEPKQDSQ